MEVPAESKPAIANEVPVPIQRSALLQFIMPYTHTEDGLELFLCFTIWISSFYILIKAPLHSLYMVINLILENRKGEIKGELIHEVMLVLFAVLFSLVARIVRSYKYTQ